MLVVAMGKLFDAGLNEPTRREELSFAKTRELGITVLSRTGTVGRYDFITMMDVPSLEAAAEFAHFFRTEGFGDPEVMPVYRHVPAESGGLGG
ncbi:hypothetical protein Rhow_008532 [Rhodococcus wratislaviensis]|uniref:Uncharacterized protein n=1 Tax=Rhodococcus wratislaviensis TaxID=44752 RepID=A0A402CKV8_RHOWR|nr:hypothetical protein [Rhodococcus wratislaviensis]GCE44234.1 hypothetical protein Rhow_008532 [Rhodococcus wratislaviensis]